MRKITTILLAVLTLASCSAISEPDRDGKGALPTAPGPASASGEPGAPSIPSPASPAPEPVIDRTEIEGTYLDIARRGVYDMVGNYWDADKSAIVNTWNGYPAGWPDPDIVDERGSVWPRCMFIMPALSVAGITKDEALLDICLGEWNNIRNLFPKKELMTPGTIVNTSVDDCGWNAFAYMRIYEAFGDEEALEIAMTLMDAVFERWYDDDCGGFSLWYRDARDFKSLYQVGVLLTCFDISEVTGDESWGMLAKTCYDTLEGIQLRSDGIYFSDYNKDGPIGKERPNDIREAGSVSFLAGNMAMAVLHARLYRITGDEMYLGRALRTVGGIQEVLTVKDGVLLNERDAWATGTFTPQYAAEVLTLPGITEDDKTVLYNTAASIAVNARTEDGFYGGSWSGPADGPGSAWYRAGSKPQQIMTSGNSVLVLAGAAVLEYMERIR